MTPLVAFALILLAGYSHATQRIVGGNSATVESYPWIVQVDSYNRFTGVWSQNCAATIINNLNVLSAAHCFDGYGYEPTQRRIRAGATYRNAGGVVLDVVTEFNHPSFDAVTLDYDITVVRLYEALPFGTTIGQAAVPPQSSVVAEGLPVLLLGWGLTAQDGAASSVLLYTAVSTVNLDYCRQLYENVPNANDVTNNMLCAGLVEGRGACGGDAGGPVLYGNMVVGVVSWFEGCGDATLPSVSAAVSPHTDWIVDTAQASTYSLVH